MHAKLGILLTVALTLAPTSSALARQQHHLPLLMSTSDPGRQGLARIINHSAEAGTVQIHAIDDSGREASPVILSIAARATVHLTTRDLERGNPGKGLSGSIGRGRGQWRLKLKTDLDIEPLAYIRTPDGLLNSIHEVAHGESMQWRIPIFSPARSEQEQSAIRLINTSGIDTEVTIAGLDDAGNDAPGGEVKIQLPADEAHLYTAWQLEEGFPPLEGNLGEGSGKWQLLLSADRPIQAMGLMTTLTGHITNLSSTNAKAIIRGGSESDELWGGNGDDTIDPGDNGHNPGEFDIVHGSDGNDRIVYTGSGPSGAQSLQYAELTAGVEITIDGIANKATVAKSAASTDIMDEDPTNEDSTDADRIDESTVGTDTIVDIANPLNASGSPPYDGYLELHGTPFDDTFDLALDDGQWMTVVGNAGADTFDIKSGTVRIDYQTSPGGVDVDLAAGRANDDGFGSADTIDGTVWGVAGSDFSDVIRGSDNDETFTGRAGNDQIDGGGGFDRLQFGSSNPRYAPFWDIGDIDLDLRAGTVTGTWNGEAFSYTLSNIERVHGGSGDDILQGTDGGDRLGGGGGDDTINPRSNDWTIRSDFIDGSTGNDEIVYTDSTGDDAYQHLSYLWVHDAYHDVEGLTITIDGSANYATVDKGTDGIDTIVDIVNPLSKAGFGIQGTSADDVFDVNLDDGQWMQVTGGPGNDRFETRDVIPRIDYASPTPRNGIDVDLAAARAHDDGFGDVDTYIGRVREIRGSDLSDTIRGSDNDESFIGRRGNDVIDGRGGWDVIRFDRNSVGDVHVDLEAGTATGIWGDSAFTHTTPWFLEPIVEQVIGSVFAYELSNIEEVHGSDSGNDRIDGDDADNRLLGEGGNDILDGRAGDDRLDGGNGDDILVGGPGENTFHGGNGRDTFVIGYKDGPRQLIDDFTKGEDRIDLNAWGIESHADVLSAVSIDENDTGLRIDLTHFADDGIFEILLLGDFNPLSLDASDFLL